MRVQRPYILVVDDDSDIREAFRDALDAEGYRVVTAGDGVEAMGLLVSGREPPSLVLLDLMMPRRNGWELLAMLRLSPGFMAVPIVVVSAYQGTPPEGAIAWLKKPLELDALLGAVKKHAKAA